MTSNNKHKKEKHIKHTHLNTNIGADNISNTELSPLKLTPLKCFITIGGIDIVTLLIDYISVPFLTILSPRGIIAAFVWSFFCVLLIFFLNYYYNSEQEKLLNEIRNEKEIRQDWRKLVSKAKNNPELHIRSNAFDKCNTYIRDLERKHRRRYVIANIGCWVLICGLVVSSVPLVATGLKKVSLILEESEADFAVVSSSSEQLADVYTPVLNPIVSVPPTVTPAEQDYSEIYFGILFTEYFGGFNLQKINSVEAAVKSATEIIETTWLNPDALPDCQWPLEYMDIYGMKNYEKAAKQENILRQTPLPINYFIAGITYIESTTNAIKSGNAFSERTLGLACLRGCELLVHYLRNKTDILKKGTAYNSIACLLRHAADNLYVNSPDKAFTLYTFAFVCYQKAEENGYCGTTLTDDKKDMLTSMKNNFPS